VITRSAIAGRSRLSRRGRVTVALAAVVLSFGVYALSAGSERLGDVPLFLLAITIALGAIAYGLRGGLALAGLSSALAAGWWLEVGDAAFDTWLVPRIFACLFLGGLLGWFVDSRDALVRELETHAELSLDLIATASFDGYFLRVNPAFTRTLGFSAEELRSRPFLDFVHPDDREPTLEAVARQTREGRDILNFQNRYRTKGGDYRWLEWTSRPDPRAHALVAVARDVTDRKQLEQLDQEHRRTLEDAVKAQTEELRRRNADLDEARRETLRRLALAAEYRDDDTYQHIDRVGKAAALLAAELGLSGHEVELIRDAAPLHDLGKLGVSDAVLLKPGRLTGEEFEALKRHAEIGRAILAGSRSDVLRMAEEIALGHHEWWDGSGYPAGLAGEAIPVTARIVAVVDVFDALTHDRPYKRAWALEDALAEMQRLRGTQFDPAVIDAFARLDPYEVADLPRGREGSVESRAVA
jgi:PAS domain S-box-containing protein